MVSVRKPKEIDPDKEEDSQLSTPASPLNLNVLQWVVVSYDSERFPGKITECDYDDIEVSVMHKSGQNLLLKVRYFKIYRAS